MSDAAHGQGGVQALVFLLQVLPHLPGFGFIQDAGVEEDLGDVAFEKGVDRWRIAGVGIEPCAQRSVVEAEGLGIPGALAGLPTVDRHRQRFRFRRGLDFKNVRFTKSKGLVQKVAGAAETGALGVEDFEGGGGGGSQVQVETGLIIVLAGFVATEEAPEAARVFVGSRDDEQRHSVQRQVLTSQSQVIVGAVELDQTPLARHEEAGLAGAEALDEVPVVAGGVVADIEGGF